jgi:hypothetical protein
VKCRRVKVADGRAATLCVYGRKYGFAGKLHFPSGKDLPVSTGNARTLATAWRAAAKNWQPD